MTADPMKAKSSKDFCIRYKKKHGKDARKTLARGLQTYWEAHPKVFQEENGESLAHAKGRIKT